jgi:DNA-binding transcriptional MocR family regulator
MSLFERNHFLFEHKQHRFSHLTEELSRKLCQGRYYSAKPDRRGLVLSYGGLELQEIERAGGQLVSIVQARSST